MSSEFNALGSVETVTFVPTLHRKVGNKSICKMKSGYNFFKNLS